MAANGRISTATITLLLHQTLVQSLAHAMQPLKFEVAVLSCPGHYGCHSYCVVAHKRRKNIGILQQIAGAGEIGHIRRRLACEERIIARSEEGRVGKEGVSTCRTRR